MHIPTPLAGEHSKGYLGRVRRLNGDLPLATLRHLLETQCSVTRAGGRSINWVRLLSAVSGLGLERYVGEHTLIPFLRTVHTASAGVAYGSQSSDVQLALVGTAMGNTTANFCSECNLQDRMSPAGSYWRRAHQLPGAVVCTVHGCALVQVDVDAPVLGPPVAFEKSARPISDQLVADAHTNLVIHRYMEICHQFLTGKHPINAKQAARNLAGRASELQLRISAIGVKRNLSDYAIAKIAGPWLQHFFPWLSDKQPGKFVAQLDGTCISKHTSYHASSYALALAVLWDTPDKAMAEFRRAIIPVDLSSDGATRQGEHMGRLQSGGLPKSVTTHHSPGVTSAIRSFVAGSSLAAASAAHDVCASELEEILRRAAARDVFLACDRRALS